MKIIIFWALGLVVGIITSILNPECGTIEAISSNLLNLSIQFSVSYYL